MSALRDPHKLGRYAACMQGIHVYAETLRDSRVNGRDISESEREDLEHRMLRLLSEAQSVRTAL